MRFANEPDFRHGTEARSVVVLVNLGSPEAPTKAALRRYLAQFLSDPRVVEIAAPLWKLILHGIILRLRPAKSAVRYANIWSTSGSPLKVHTEKQAKLLRGYLGERGLDIDVAYAMRYGNPAIPVVLNALKARNVQRILLVPLYPQYSATTTASVVDVVAQWLQRVRNQPELRTIKHFHDDPGYIEALATTVEDYWQRNGRLNGNDKLLISFHGVPKRTLLHGDPYHCECQKTARLLTERLALEPDQVRVTFQSRFGKTEWLKPYTAPTLVELAKQKTERVDVICPGFVSDCLETLEEMAIEGKEKFLTHGGKAFHYIPCLNENNTWIHALADLVEQHLQGWPVQRLVEPNLQQASHAALETSRLRALAKGAEL